MFESLSNFLTPDYQNALKNGYVIFDTLLLMDVGSESSNSTDTPTDLADFNNLVENDNLSGENDSHIVGAEMEKIDLPVVALILATLMSIFVYRRKE